MAIGESGTVLRPLRTILSGGAVSGMSDAQLLERFTSRRHDLGELALEAIVQRHGPMVLAICRSLLRDAHDAEDAFQATFLVLVRKANRIWVKDSLSGWLSAVAYRVAARARSTAARRRSREWPLDEVDPAAGPNGDADVRALLHEELARLPERYRMPIVLCHLEGHTHDEAARELRWPVGTVRSRLARGRNLLRSRLVRRGLGATVATVASALPTEFTCGAVPSELGRSTVQAALQVATGGSVAAGSISASALLLTEGVLRSMFYAKLKVAGCGVLLAGVLASGIRVSGQAQPVQRSDNPAAAPGGAQSTGVEQGRDPRTSGQPQSRPLDSGLAGSAPAASDAKDERPALSSPYELETRLRSARGKLEIARKLHQTGQTTAVMLADAQEVYDTVVAQIRTLHDDLDEQLELLRIRLDVKKAEYKEAEARNEAQAIGLDSAQQNHKRAVISRGELELVRLDARTCEAKLQAKAAEMREVETRIKHIERRLDRLNGLKLD
jgi:RNA polymerase sigma factor (sigma-70 family)